MKSLVLIGCFMHFLGNVGCSQNKYFNVRIDSTLKYPLYDFLPYGSSLDINFGNLDSTNINGSGKGYDIVSNADLKEFNKKHLTLDTCRSFFSDDTLVIEFGRIRKRSSDKIFIMITEERSWGFLESEEISIVSAELKSLAFKYEVNKRGDEIYGELIIDIPDKNGNLKYAFRGPFRCIIE